jgi:RNA polymerase sigma factor (sigma-70 family)
MTRSDAQLVSVVLRGDAEAFRELMERHQDSVYRIALRCTACTEPAMDITQEAFLRAFANLRKLKDPAYFYGWLRQIALNLCTDWLRARNGHPRSLDTLREQGFDVGVASSQPRVSSVEHAVHSRTVKEIVLKAMEQLAPNDQEILLLRYFEGLSLNQISASLSLTPNAAKVRLFRAREALRPMLQEHYSNGELTNDGLSIRPM